MDSFYLCNLNPQPYGGRRRSQRKRSVSQQDFFMMNLLSNGKYNNEFGKTPTAKPVKQEQGTNNNNNDDDEDRPIETLRTSYLPDDCLNLILMCLKSRDRNSFGLTCRQWLHIQNNNQEFLVFRGRRKDGSTTRDEWWFPVVLSKLLTRFQHLKYLTLQDSPKLETLDFVTTEPRLFESKVQELRLCYCTEYSDFEFSIMFSWFPRLRYISLSRSYSITDKGLEALARCCSSLKKVQLWASQFITDSGIRFLLQNCRELRSLCFGYCTNITGIGFLDCPKTLTHLEASQCISKPEGIKAIVSGGGLEYLSLLTYEPSINTEALVTISNGCPLLKELILANCENVNLEGWESIARNCKNLESLNVRKCRDVYRRSITTEVVVTISKGCPLLKELILTDCEDVKLEGWEAIGQNCKNLESLSVHTGSDLCDLWLQALCNGSNKLSKLSIDARNRSICSSGLELFKREKPQCCISFH